MIEPHSTLHIIDASDLYKYEHTAHRLRLSISTIYRGENVGEYFGQRENLVVLKIFQEHSCTSQRCISVLFST